MKPSARADKHIEQFNKIIIERSIISNAWNDFYAGYSSFDDALVSNDINVETPEQIKFLDLSQAGISTLPKKLINFKALEVLDLSSSAIKNFADLRVLENLKVLIMDFCHVGNVDFIKYIPKSIILLSLEYCNLKSLNFKENILDNILLLNIANNRFVDLAFLSEKVPGVIELNVKGNNIKKFSSSFYTMPNLRRLNVNGNNISSIEIEASIPLLAELAIMDNSIKFIPDSFSNLSGLISLHIKQNPIEGIGSSLSHLGIKHLCISDIEESLFEDVCEIISLQSLEINDSSIGEINDSIGNLINLESLELEDCDITKISSEIEKCSKLKFLSLINNGLEELPDSFGNLQNLQQLNLSNNLFAKVPDAMTNIKGLKLLFFHNNFLVSIPDSIGSLINLTVAFFSNNRIEVVSDKIGSLTNLSTLMLDNNKLQYVPDEIGKLTNLQDIALDANGLLEYPTTMADLHKLNKIYNYRNDNPLSNMPEVKGMGLVQLFDYLNQKRGRAKFAIEWEVPLPLQTAFQQYMNFFTDYVLKLTGHNVTLEVNKIEKGLKLITQSTPDLSIEAIDEYLTQFVGYFIKDNTEELDSILEAQQIAKRQVFEVRQLMRDLKFENRNLRDKIQGQFEKIVFLSDNNQEKNRLIDELQVQIRFFTQHSSSLLKLLPSRDSLGDVNVNVSLIANSPHSNILENFSDESLLSDIVDKAARMLERKKVEKIEDLHNNDIAHYLRDKQYYVTDQTQSGIASINLGELDVMIRKANGTPISIIEAFKLESCGDKNVEISSHINKLLHNYDSSGLKTNYIIVYAYARKFESLWKNYVKYIRNINDKPEFIGEHHLISFMETNTSSPYSEIKIGLALHQRSGSLVKVYHVFVNMYVG